MCRIALATDANGFLLIPCQVGVSASLAEALKREGRAVPEPIDVVGLIDTGADGLAIDLSIAERLGIVAHKYTRAETMDGPRFPKEYSVSLTLSPANDGVNFPQQACCAFSNLKRGSAGVDVLIGVKMLAQFQLEIAWPESEFILTFVGT